MTLETPTPDQDPRWRRRNRPRLGTGLFLIALGVLLALDQWHGSPFHRTSALWPLILIALGLSRMVDRGFLSWGAHALMVTGVAFELQALGHEVWVHRLWPLGVVWVGIIITLRALRARRTPGCEWIHD